MRGEGGRRYGGYYTITEAKEIVSYANTLGIEIIPEIDIPGHSYALLASLPELDIEGLKSTGRSINPGRDIVYEVFNIIFKDILDIFPSPIIHTGADEVMFYGWKESEELLGFMEREGIENGDPGLQDYFVKRVENIIMGQGRRVGGWEEMAYTGLVNQSSVIYLWKLGWTESIRKLALRPNQFVLCPADYFYFDQKYFLASKEPGLGWAGGLDLKKVYSFPDIEDRYKPQILGFQCCLWSELFYEVKNLEFSAFPRMLALAETAWTPYKLRKWDDFKARGKIHQLILDIFGVNYRPYALGWEKNQDDD